MTAARTPSHELARRRVADAGDDLDALVAEMRAAGIGWSGIERLLLTRYGLRASYASLRRWYGEPKPATTAAA